MQRSGTCAWQSLWAALLLPLLAFLCAGCAASVVPPLERGDKTRVVVPTLEASPFPNAARIDAYLASLAEGGVLSGSVLVARDGMLFSRGYGLADKDTRIPNTPATRFRIGSITKQFTALAILILQDRGKLHVQDHICLYILACPQDWQSITIEQLLTHTSGIPDYTNFPDFAVTWTLPTTPEQLIARFKNMPLDFPPGSIFKYSSSGYVLLGYIIERLTGETYATFLRENIFAPLKMINTGYDSTHPSLPQHATGYYKGYIQPDAYDTSVLYAAGALYSTVEDLYLWDQALSTQKLVLSQALAAMLSVHVPCPPSGPGGCLLRTDLGYGYGWFIAAEPQGKLLYHVGHIDGFFTYNGFYPEHNLDIVVLSNLETTNVLQIGRTLASMV